MTNFVEIVPFTYIEPEVKKPITINVDFIKAVSLDENTLAKVFVSDEIKKFFKEEITDNEFIYVVEPTYEELAKILTQKEVREQNKNNMNE